MSLSKFVVFSCLIWNFSQASEIIPGSGAIAKLIIDQNSEVSLEVSMQIGDIQIMNTEVEEGEFVRLSLLGFHTSNDIGSPELPEIHKLIEIPQNAMPRIEIISEEVEYYSLSDYGIEAPIYPHQPSLSKSQTPDDVPFEWNEVLYQTDAFMEHELISVEIKGDLRSLRLANLVIRPVDYNAVSGIIRVTKSVDFIIHYDGADIVKTQALKEAYYSPYFESVYRQVANYKPLNDRDDLVSYPVTYVIITNPIFENTLSEFIDWKIQRGFTVVVGNTSVIGSSTSAIKSYIQDLYENPTDEIPAPSFVLFVGDVAQVPTYSGSTGGHVTDLYYVEMTGDMVPDIYHGRFSAQNLSQLQSQISKTLEYEKYEMPDPSYLEEVIMIAGVDAGMAPTYGNGQINYGTDYYFNEDHGIFSHTYLYPASDAPSAAAAIIQDYNEGVGFANYTAHCSSAGWADPSFTTSDVPGLTNEHEYNLMIGNCCTSTAFDAESFGEAVLRAENSGAVGYIGGTNSTYWNEDYWWGVGSGSISANPTYMGTGPGVYDGIFHDHGEDESQWFVVNDAINMAGNLAVVEAGGNEDYYWEIYHNMGDPSLITYMGVPSENNVSHLPILQIGTGTFNISADPYSHIALSMNGVLYGSAFTGSSSDIEMEITPFALAGTASVVVTGQNKQPYLGSVEVGNADGPYVVVDDFTLMTSDGDNMIEYGETVNISMDLKNVGSELTEGVEVNLSIDDEYITLTDSQASFGNIAPDAISSSADAFSFTVSTDVPDDYSFSFLATATGSGEVWDYNLNMTAYAPVLSFEGVSVDDPDGQLDPGDTADIGVIIRNSGGSGLSGMRIIISSSDEYITINGESDFYLGSLGVDEDGIASYNVTADSNTPIGHIIPFDLLVTASGPYEENISGSLTVGLTWEDFESGSFVNLPWSFAGNADWEITSEAYEGNYGAGSGPIVHNESSEVNLSVNVTASDEISFYYKVSSEGSYDYLRFYIDGNEMGAWSGEISWALASYSVSSGEHTFRWAYTKDGSVDSGSDRGWIDYIIFPPIGAPAFPDIHVNTSEISVALDAYSEETEQFVISNTGEGELQYSIQSVLDAPETFVHKSLKLEKGAEDPRSGMAPTRGSGGPDAFGYTWIDSDELGGPNYTWVEIDFCGIPIGTADDSNEGPFELGFPFYFYGNEYNSVRVSTNGFLSFTSTATSYTNQPIPSSEDPNALLAPFWDDLNPTNGGQIYYFSWGDHFVVQYNEIPHYSGGGPETFQVVIYDDGNILFNYKTVDTGNSCTVGIENESGDDGLQVVFDANYLHNEMTILFSSDYLQPWLTIFPLTGTLPPGGESIVSASFDSAELLEGVYTGSISIISNDPDEMIIELPVTMNVGSGCGDAGDLNGDGDVSILDIISMINCILHDECPDCSDINGDSQVNIQDIITLINIILD